MTDNKNLSARARYWAKEHQYVAVWTTMFITGWILYVVIGNN